MKALILLGTLKTDQLSHTQTLVEFFCKHLDKQHITHQTIKLADHHIPPGTYTDMGDEADDWPAIYDQILAADILLFATPIWWQTQSSLTQRAIERLDEVHDIITAGKTSPLKDKIGGVIITGDSDGVQHVTGNLTNFMNNLGMTIPPFANLGVTWEGHAKSARRSKSQLLQYYKSNHTKDAKTMAQSLAQYTKK